MPPVTKLSDQPELVPTKNYPHAKFPFEFFNPVQSRVFDFYDKDTSAVIAAATSAGKTVMSELFMSYAVRVLKKKALYLSPMRALAQEKYDDWSDKNYHFNDLKVSICTGDYRMTKKRIEELERADIIIMSSEMLNHRARNHKSEQSKFLSEIAVCVVDESHLLTVPGRGDHLEAGLMKFTELNPKCNLVLLSATMPNVGEIADWVSYILTKRNTILVKSTYRPCPLNLHYEKYQEEINYEDNELQKISMAMQIVEYYPEDKFLIFAHTKKTGEMMKSILQKSKIKCEFHNANLTKEKRIALEKSFKEDKDFRVVVATSTLAWGCYAKGTPVLVEKGTKKIEDIQCGDSVYAMGPKGYELRKVLKAGTKTSAKSLEFITYNGEKVVVSNDHKFYGAVGRLPVGYYKASEFSIDDYVAVHDLTPTRKDYIPVREFIRHHAETNDVNTDIMTTSVGLDLYEILNLKDLVRSKCQKLVEKYPVPSKLTELLDTGVKFSRVKSIRHLPGQVMYDLTVEGLSNYVGGGIVSHNCNLPARRVIILGVHRAMNEVATYDIFQMIGRTGRPGYDPMGDAYILLPENNYEMHKERLKKPQAIRSQMLEDFGGKYKTLAFHLVSEIYQGNIKDKDDVHYWYKRSLAAFQSHELDDEVVDKTIELLKKYGAVWEEDGKYTATAVGKISSMFYFSPFDVYDYKRNFNLLFDNNKEKDDLWVSVALGNVDTQRCGIVSRVEREEISRFARQVSDQFGQGTIFEPAVKAAFAYNLLITGRSNSHFTGVVRGLQSDFQRVSQVLQALDSFSGKWGQGEWFRRLGMRVTYGVKGDLVHLCDVPQIGRVRATKLWEAGLRTIEAVANNPDKVKACLGVKKDLLEEIITGAKSLILTS